MIYRSPISSIQYRANVLRLLGHLQDLKHSNSDNVTHDLVALGCEMQSIIPEPLTQILLDTCESNRAVEIKGITVEQYCQPLRAEEQNLRLLSAGEGCYSSRRRTISLAGGWQSCCSESYAPSSLCRLSPRLLTRSTPAHSLQYPVPPSKLSLKPSNLAIRLP